jgi:hypothetical protein
MTSLGKGRFLSAFNYFATLAERLAKELGDEGFFLFAQSFDALRQHLLDEIGDQTLYEAAASTILRLGARSAFIGLSSALFAHGSSIGTGGESVSAAPGGMSART